MVGYLGSFWYLGTNFLDRITGFFYHEGTKGNLASGRSWQALFSKQALSQGLAFDHCGLATAASLWAG